jgi:hypothetical protein
MGAVEVMLARNGSTVEGWNSRSTEGMSAGGGVQRDRIPALDLSDFHAGGAQRERSFNLDTSDCHGGQRRQSTDTQDATSGESVSLGAGGGKVRTSRDQGVHVACGVLGMVACKSWSRSGDGILRMMGRGVRQWVTWRVKARPRGKVGTGSSRGGPLSTISLGPYLRCMETHDVGTWVADESLNVDMREWVATVTCPCLRHLRVPRQRSRGAAAVENMGVHVEEVDHASVGCSSALTMNVKNSWAAAVEHVGAHQVGAA